MLCSWCDKIHVKVDKNIMVVVTASYLFVEQFNDYHAPLL